MKTTYIRRSRRSRTSGRSEGAFFNKDHAEPAFFEAQSASPFFQSQSVPIQRKCDKCEKEEQKEGAKNTEQQRREDKMLNRKEAATPSKAIRSLGSVIQTVNSPAQALPANLASKFGSRMGFDFSTTKIHLGSLAGNSAKSINAKAYTLGSHVVFGDNQYNPDTYEGKKLIAHELAHVVQQHRGYAGIYRLSDNSEGPAKEETTAEEQPVMSFGTGETQYADQVAFANCEGVNVQGVTHANYSHNYSFSGTTTTGSNCSGCTAANCISETGTIDSTFTAAPTVSLPSPPAGLSDCERNAVQTAINTTLAAHEQQHVDAFNTYNGSESTPYTYNGCRAGKAAFIRQRHNSIESARRAASNALSAALDPFNMTIPCDCPEPASTQPTITPAAPNS